MIEIAVFIGILLYVLIYAPLRLGVHQDYAYAVGIVFLAMLVSLTGYWYYSIVVPFTAGTLTGTALSNTFIVFLGGMAALGYGATLALYLAAPHEKRRKIAAGVCLVTFMVVLLGLSFWGSFGYDTVPLLAFPWDLVAVAIAGVILHFFALFSSYKTPELAAIEAAHLEEVAPLPEAEGGGSGGAVGATSGVRGYR